MKYKVQHDYESSLGSYDKGATVDLEEAQADHINRDSPGTLKPVRGKKASSKDDEPKANDGTVDEVIARVGDDPDAAAEALEAEQAEKKPRSSLVEALEAVVGGDDGDDSEEG